jgi:S-DNA-T family DNA segregation ATPase FtsK/SpoIIIE
MTILDKIIAYSPKIKLKPVNFKDLLHKVQSPNLSGLYLSIGKTWDDQNLSIEFPDLGSVLIAGMAGSGKTTLLKSIVTNIAYSNSVHEVDFYLATPNAKEFLFLKNTGYLAKPIITNPDDVLEALEVLDREIEKRYKFLAKNGGTKIYWYNWNIRMQKISQSKDTKLIKEKFLILDDYHQLIKNVSRAKRKRIEEYLVKILQVGRAAGVYMILSSEDVSNKVLSDLVSANFMNRVCFKTKTKQASEDMMYYSGAQRLNSRGDAFVVNIGSGTVILRIRTADISTSDLAIALNNKK